MAAAVEFRDIAPGKFARVLASVGSDTDVIALDPSSKRRPPRAIVVAGFGDLVVVGLDGVTVTLPDMGIAWQWDLQITEILTTGTTATNIVLLW